jgi:hypothetical protein
MVGWGHETDEDWRDICLQSGEYYQSGRFLIEQLGAERHLDPHTMAVLWRLREALLYECSEPTVSQMMLIDLAIVGYYNFFRLQGWIGNLAMIIESECFGPDALSLKAAKAGRKDTGIIVEDMAARLVDTLFPLLDRANKMVARNLRAINEIHRGSTASVAVARADSINVAKNQINIHGARPR